MPNEDKSKMNTTEKKGGIFSLPNDNIVKTLVVAILLCLVCSIIVSTAAVLLKPKQVANKLFDKKKNILSVAGIDFAGQSSDAIDALFNKIEPRVVDLQTGDYSSEIDALTFDQRKASKDPMYRVKLSSEQDIAQIGGRSKYASIYLVKDEVSNDVTKYILPIKGYGLWSTLYGFICLEADANTACNISFYEHAETPGLGGEIENKKWQALWAGKKVTDTSGMTKLRVVKGVVNKNTAGAEHKVDGLAGATLTSQGVSNLIQFWLGKDGFGPYLNKLRSQSTSQTINNGRG